MRGRWTALVARILFCSLAPSPTCAWQGGAEGQARAGITTLGRIEDSPGVPLPGPRFAFDLWEPYAGTGLVGAGLHAAWETRAVASAAALRQLRSPVHRATDGLLALQVRWAGHRAGAALHTTAQEFDGYRPQWSAVVRLGAGTRHARSGVAVAASLDVASSARLRVGAALPLAPRLQVLLEEERVPGAPERVRVAVVWALGPLRLAAGYDPATRAAAMGCSGSDGRWAVAWGASDHPELGWSHAWTLAR